MYGKLFASIYTGSLYGKVEACAIMQAMIAFADSDGFVDMSFPAIVGTTGFPREFVEKGLSELMQPDPISRTEGEQGRRILPVTPSDATAPTGVNGYVIVNYRKYAAIAKRADKQQADRERIAQKRAEKHKVSQGVAKCRKVSQGVAKCRPLDIDIDVDVDKEQTAPISSARHVAFDAFWESVHRKVGKQAARKAFERAVDRKRQELDQTFAYAAEFITTRMRLFAASPQAADEVRGTLHPATWLNEGRYDDDESTWAEGHKTENVREAALQAAQSDFQKRREVARQNLKNRGLL